MSTTHVLKSLVLGMPRMFVGGTPSERAGTERLAPQKLTLASSTPIAVSSPAFADGATIPVRYTQDGEGLSPPIRWGKLPAGTHSLALVVEDPDAPTPQPFVHWLVADLDPERGELPEGLPPFGTRMLVQGKNTLLKHGYLGCAPPKGDSPHAYHFQLFALDASLGVEPGFGREELLKRMEGHVLGVGEVVGTYARPR